MTRIRPATAADAPALAALRYEFRAGLVTAAEPRDAFVGRCVDWMAGRLGDAASGWLCWIAEDGDETVGNVWIYRLPKVPNPVGEPEAHAYVTNLFVRPAFRGGTGSRLLEAALARCRSERVDSVILWPTPESRSLYARHGFTGGDAIMELALNG